MNRLIRNAASTVLTLLAMSAAAQGQATRTWVSGVGDDANPCSRTAPCKTFAGTISKTARNGEINVIDAGSFGAVTITKSITINADWQFGGILAAGINGIIINITDPADTKKTVVLRNLDINGAASGINGIRFLAGSQLVVENCIIHGFTTHGLDVNAATPAQISVSNTRFSDLGSVGVRIAGAVHKVALTDVLIQKALVGFDVIAGGIGTIRNSTIIGVTNQAIVAEGPSVINVDGGVVANNGTGVSAFSNGSTVRIANLAILNNTTGISIAAGGTVASFGGNKNAGNTTAGAPNANLLLQ